MSSEKLNLRVELEDEYVEMFNDIKDEMAFKTNTQVLRYAIYQSAMATNFKLDEDFIKIIQSYIEKDYLKTKYKIFNINDFIKKAIEKFIEEIDRNSPSIKNWKVRANLPEEEVDIALEFLKIQESKIGNEVTITELAKKLNTRDIKHLKETLENWEENGIIEKRITSDKTYYHAE